MGGTPFWFVIAPCCLLLFGEKRSREEEKRKEGNWMNHRNRGDKWEVGFLPREEDKTNHLTCINPNVNKVRKGIEKD